MRLVERFFPPARNSCNALITSSEGYHKWARGLSEGVSCNKYLVFTGRNKLIFFWLLDTPVSEFDGSQSGNITMKSWLWSWHNIIDKLSQSIFILETDFNKRNYNTTLFLPHYGPKISHHPNMHRHPNTQKGNICLNKNVQRKQRT